MNNNLRVSHRPRWIITLNIPRFYGIVSAMILLFFLESAKAARAQFTNATISVTFGSPDAISAAATCSAPNPNDGVEIQGNIYQVIVYYDSNNEPIATVQVTASDTYGTAGQGSVTLYIPASTTPYSYLTWDGYDTVFQNKPIDAASAVYYYQACFTAGYISSRQSLGGITVNSQQSNRISLQA